MSNPALPSSESDDFQATLGFMDFALRDKDPEALFDLFRKIEGQVTELEDRLEAENPWYKEYAK
jgi:hypothetical protein